MFVAERGQDMRLKIRMSIGFCLCVIFLFILTISVFASDANGKGSLTVIFEKENSDVKIDGASIGVYKVADLDFVQGQAVYTLKSDYSQFLKKDDGGHDVTFDGLTADASQKLAKDLSSVVKTAVEKGVTDTNGEFKVNGLEQGMYLIGQIGKSGTAEKYKAFDPFLISVPLFNEETKKWETNVVTHPKTTVEELSGTPTPTPDVNGGSSGGSSGGGVNRSSGGYQTGDIAIGGLIGASLAAILVLIIAFIRKRKNDKE